MELLTGPLTNGLIDSLVSKLRPWLPPTPILLPGDSSLPFQGKCDATIHQDNAAFVQRCFSNSTSEGGIHGAVRFRRDISKIRELIIYDLLDVRHVSGKLNASNVLTKEVSKTDPSLIELFKIVFYGRYSPDFSGADTNIRSCFDYFPK